MNETLYLVDGRTALRTERRLAHRPEKVWRAVTEPEHLEQWFPFRVELEPRVGGAVRFVPKGPDDGPETAGVVTELDPPRAFAFTWGETDDLRFEIVPDGDAACLLVLTHTFGDHYGAASFTAGWQVCLDAMEAAIDGRAVEAPGDMADAHDRYIAAFGLDEGSVDDIDGGWRVRFERQMTRPAETVWSVLGGSGATVGRLPPRGLTAAGIHAGAVTTVDDGKVVEYEWVDGARAATVGRVRVELGPGTGQGPRLVVTQTGPPGRDRASGVALDAWKARLAELAAELRATGPS